jgi:hypothetical protein
VSDRTRSDEKGIHFPAIDGRRSSQVTGKRIFAAAVRFVDAGVAERIETTGNWRKGYLGAVRDTFDLGARSTKDALRVASDGLDALRKHFVFERGEESLALEGAFAASDDPTFRTEIVQGGGAAPSELEIPYRGELLRGDRLLRQLDHWRVEGTIEPSCAAAVAAVVDNPQWLDLRDVRVALLGAASEMGPLQWLTRWGSDILAVDLPVEDLWERIIEMGIEGAGRVHVPVRGKAGVSKERLASVAGADLLTEAPEIASWLADSGEPFNLGNYAYADGGLFARVAVAADAITTELQSRHRLTGYAYLASPTEVYSVPSDAVRASQSKGVGIPQRLLRAASGNRLFCPNYSDVSRSEQREWGIFDCLVSQQGANYALAKTLQRWRAVTARDQGLITSANVAPATRTRSVVKNRVLAAAYAGAGPFGVEVFEPETSRALMAALLVHDIRNLNGSAHPDTSLEHPYDLFSSGAAHGGLWRMRYAPRSALPLAVVLGYPRNAVSRRSPE